jgi:hypothetical protein
MDFNNISFLTKLTSTIQATVNKLLHDAKFQQFLSEAK